jgi:hypothetical protein
MSADVNANALGFEMLMENKLMEVEQEAERQLCPFPCGVRECQHQYKNMNSL